MASRSVLVLGGSGALGRQCVARFQAAGWRAISADLVKNESADVSLPYGRTQSSPQSAWAADTGGLLASLADHGVLGPSTGGLGAVVCVAGGWAGGSVADNSLFDAADAMIDSSVRPALAAAHVAAHRLAPGGLLALTGAAPALAGGTPGMAAYGAAKAAVHHITLTASAEGLPDGAAAVAILPNTLDTPGNRAGMPDADTSSWTPLSDVADQLVRWAERSPAPTNGGLYAIETAGGVTDFRMVSK